MSDAATTVTAFMAAFAARDVDAIMAFFAEDAIYHNMPLKPAQGHDAIRKVVTQFVKPAERIQFDITHIAAAVIPSF